MTMTKQARRTERRTRRPTALACMAAVLGAAALPAGATNGYFAHGYGLKAKGMGGASTALAHDSLAAAYNPAAMVRVGSRFDLGGDVFRPIRDAERSGAGIPTLNGQVDSGRETFLIPEFGVNRMLRPDLAVGLTVYGNGGMNTDYPQGNFNCGSPTGNNILCGQGRIGVDLIQLIVAPTLAYKLSPQHAVGASLLIGHQRFEARGLQAFDNAPGFPPFTASPGKVTNRGKDSSNGFGLRVGYQGSLTDSLDVGAAYASKMRMSRFEKYEGLFAERGDFDIPSNWNIGLAWRPASGWTIAFDFQRINYSDVASVSNASMPTAPLGTANGPGFGWQDVDVRKIGISWQATPDLLLRAGYNHGDNPIRSADVTFNILAPGVVRRHFTLGFTQKLDAESELTGALMVAQRESVRGASLFNGLFPAPPQAGGQEEIRMRQVSIGLAYGRSF